MSDKLNRRTAILHTTDRRTLNKPRRHYRIPTGTHSLAIDLIGQPYVDRSAMSARAVISTATIDRVGDLLVPGGCQLANYEKNPVVLWAHGLEGIGQPIATSRSPGGTLGVTITETEVEATSWFSQSSVEAAQIFELIDEGIVRATSVRETPLKSRIHHNADTGDILVVEEWELEEWSWCAVGVNPDAVARALDRNRLGGQPIAPSIIKSLTAVAPIPRRFGVGIPSEKRMAATNLQNDDSADALNDIPAVPWDDNSNDIHCQPYGATVVSAAYSSLASACQNIEEALGPLENPNTKQGLGAILNVLQEQLTALQGLYSCNYPEQPTLKSDDEGDDGGDDDDDAMKAFLASGQMAPLRMLGLGARLKGMVGDRNLTPAQRQTLTGVAQQIARLVSQSKSHQCRDEDAKVLALQRSINELSQLVGNITK